MAITIGGGISLGGGIAFTPATDPYWSSTSLLLPGQSFTDASSNNITVTATNAVISSAQSKWGGSSMYFDGSGDWVNTAATSALEFGSGNFTIETWIRPSDSGRRSIYHGSSGVDWSVGIDCDAQKFRIWASSNGTSWNLINSDGGGNGIGTINMTINAWNHVAFVRNGTTWQTYVNGVRDLNLTGISGTLVDRSAYAKSIGKWWFSNGAGNPTTFDGYMNDFRVTKGVARYTSNFSVPTDPFPLG
jgi:hypothetical protein